VAVVLYLPAAAKSIKIYYFFWLDFVSLKITESILVERGDQSWLERKFLIETKFNCLLFYVRDAGKIDHSALPVASAEARNRWPRL